MNEILQQKHRDTDRWWKNFYDDACMTVLAAQDPQEIQRDCDLIAETLTLGKGGNVMDQCCGLGQHSIELASRGHHVVGIDQSPLYIQAAQDHARRQHIAVEFHAADALNFVRDPLLDGVFNWHSSFGYLSSDDENIRMLQAANRSLKPGGKMLLEYPNMLHLMANFQPVMISRLPDGLTLTRRSQISPCHGTLRQSWSYQWPDGTVRQHDSCLRIYLPHQITEMLMRANFMSVELLSKAGTILRSSDARCLAVATKGTA